MLSIHTTHRFLSKNNFNSTETCYHSYCRKSLSIPVEKNKYTHVLKLEKIKPGFLDDGGESAKKVFQELIVSIMATELCVEQKKCKVEKRLSFEIL
jgi:hypothetical protein